MEILDSDMTTQGRRFQVALSFPGEKRAFVSQVADHLSQRLGRESVFYDGYYEAELARPDLDLYLGRIYHDDSELVVPFYCADYERKKWCRLEWRQMRDILFKLEGHRIMPFRFDDTPIPGVLSIDGYVEIGNRSPQDVAELILQRLTGSPVIASVGQGTRVDFLLTNTRDAPKAANPGSVEPGATLSREERMDRHLDVLIVTAADGEDTAVRAVDEGALGPWEQTDGPEGYGFKVWLCQYDTTSGHPLRVGLTRAFDMGADAAGNAAARLTDAYRPRCLAMCGVCAGRPGWTNLGDVIIADRVYRYDVGEQETTAEGKDVFLPDMMAYPFRAQWKQLAQNHSVPATTPWLSSRPRPRSMQADWVLHELLDRRNPLAAPDRDAQCADWTPVIQDLIAKKWIVLKDGQPSLRNTGKNRIQELLFRHGGRLPKQDDWRIVVGPLGTGSKLVRSGGIWDRLRKTERVVIALDMEASVVGMVAHVQNVHDMIVAKGVMDHAEPDRNYGFRAFAARAAAEVLIGFLRQNLLSRQPYDRNEEPFTITTSDETPLNVDISRMEDGVVIDISSKASKLLRIVRKTRRG